MKVANIKISDKQDSDFGEYVEVNTLNQVDYSVARAYIDKEQAILIINHLQTQFNL